MRLTIRILVLIGAAEMVAAGSAMAQTCASATDTAAVHLRVRMRRLASSVVPSDAAARASLQLPSVDSSTVVAVTQSQTCQKALSAFNSTIPGFSPLPTKIYVVKYGTVFVAMYPTNDYSFWPAAVLDSKYKVLAKFSL